MSRWAFLRRLGGSAFSSHAKQCRCSRVVRDSIAYEEDQRRVLQFTCLDSFVVRGVVVGWGLLCTLGIYWGLLRPHSASTIFAAGSCRLYCQLDKESNSLLFDRFYSEDFVLWLGTGETIGRCILRLLQVGQEVMQCLFIN
jgi:hypothetical protein